MIHRILYRWLCRYVERHTPDFVIDDDYLIRWWLIPGSNQTGVRLMIRYRAFTHTPTGEQKRSPAQQEQAYE